MITKSERIKRWRKKTKQRCVDSFGGKCGICGYSKCPEALEFHHLNPEEKEFGMGGSRANPKAWNVIVEELRKCICICSNCHKEYHCGVTQIPKNIQRYNEEYTNYKEKEREQFQEPCPMCGKLKSIHLITCSSKCAAKRATKGRYPEDINILIKQVEEYGYSETGRKYNVSDTAIRKYINNNK